MESKRRDCDWCGSAASVEYAVCQVCLMEFPNEATVIRLPFERDGLRKRVELEEKKQAGVGD